MIIPQYWAEGRRQSRQGGKQVTVRRFGWSDAGQAEAQADADTRAEAALQRILAGEKIPRRDFKVPYGGGQGLPIREEILARHGDTIITRNSYGARCLNTPDALFIDVDLEEGPAGKTYLIIFAVLLLAAVIGGIYMKSMLYGVGFAALALVLTIPIAARVSALKRRVVGDAEAMARRRFAAFLQSHPDWHLRIYRTPFGFRLLAMHRRFSADEPEVAECFRALGADPAYVFMCLQQRCFRARLSPKPWNIGIESHMRPRPGVWPIDPERMPERNRWIDNYEQKAQAYAACRFEEAIGSKKTDAAVREVQKLHDDLCRARENLPLA